MAEAGAPDCTMLVLMGHMSRAMMERYSHIRMAAKRRAVEALSFRPAARKAGGTAAPTEDAISNGVPTRVPKGGESKLIQ